MRVAQSIATVCAVAVLFIVASMSAAGQGRGGRSGGNNATNPAVVHKPVPRATDGKPDLSGTWQSGGVSITGEDGAPPLKPLPPIDNHTIRREPLVYKTEFENMREAENFTALDDPTLYCLLPGVPRIATMPMPLEIIQTPKMVVILYEAFRAWRRIPINDKLEHPNDLNPTWMGDSVGRWDGDTFVVDVIGFNDKTWIGGNGTIHTEQMHVVERYTRNTDNTITYETTVEDPGALSKPYYTGAVLRAPIDVRVEEYECIENNPDPEHMKKALQLEKNKK